MKFKFYTADEYDTRDIFADYEYETVEMVRRNGWLDTDLMTKCKSWKTAVKRFCKALNENGFAEIAEWKDALLESAENGCFSGNDFVLACGDRNPNPNWSYGIESYDDYWYVFLNVRVD